MSAVRKPAVAGQFYPDDARALQTAVRTYLDSAERLETEPKGIIVPHAGYVYSGPVAGSGYAQLEPVREKIHRVVLMGPCHYVPLRGLAVPRTGRLGCSLGGGVPIGTSIPSQSRTWGGSPKGTPVCAMPHGPGFIPIRITVWSVQ